MKSDVKVGDRTLTCAGKLAKTNIVLNYTADSSIKYETITTSGTFTVPSGVYNRIQFFAVGGGGATSGCLNTLNTTLGETTSKNVSTGGGGGGYVATCTKTCSAGDSFSIVIGAGGKAGGNSATLTSTSGSASTVSSGSTVILTAKGGGGIDATKYVKSGSSGEVWYILKGGVGGSGGGPAYFGRSYNLTYTQGAGGANGGNGTYGTVYWANTSETSHSVGESVTSLGSLCICGAAGTGAGTSTTFNGITYAYGGNGAITYSVPSSSNHFGTRPANGTGGFGGERYGGGSTGSKRVPTSGAANSGSGGGGYWMSKQSYNNLCGGSTAGGSGVVIVKLWEA